MKPKHILLGIGVLLCLIVLAFLILMVLFIFTPDSTTAIEATTKTVAVQWASGAPAISPIFK